MSITLTIWLLIVVVVLAAAAFAFRTTLLDMITSRKGYTVVRDIPYGPHERQKLDLYLPSQNADRAALIVFLYGGAWSEGSKAIYRFVAQPFASRGFLVAVPDYRLFPEVVFPAFVEDAARAVAFLAASRPLPAGEPRRLILVGHSAGAHSAALLATDRHYLAEAGLPPDPIDRMIGLAGPYDFKITKPRYKAVFPPETRAASQPISFVDGHEPPMLLIAGDSDTTVDPGNTTRFAQRIADNGGDVAVRIFAGASHIATITSLAAALPTKKPPILEAMLAFIGKPSVADTPPPPGPRSESRAAADLP